MEGAQAPSGGAVYRVLRELGARAQHTHVAVREPHELVVVQAFRRKAKGKGASFEAGVGADVFETLQRDATALMKNFHPNVARVRHVDVVNDELLIATELVDGVTLADLQAAAAKRREAALPIAVLVRVLVDVLGGLHGLHGLRDNGAALGTLHGELCPSNVVLGKDGVARIVAVFRPRPISIAAGSEAVAYAAPEALDLGGTADPRSDLYAVGVMLWEGLSGGRLFDEKHPGRVLQRQREEELQRPEVAEASGFAKLSDVAMRALAFDPSLRFRSASEMATELRRIAGTRLAPGSAVAQKVMDLAGDRIRNRRSELDQSATGARKRPSRTLEAATPAPPETGDRPTATPPESAVTAPSPTTRAPTPAAGRMARVPAALTKSETGVKIAEEKPAAPTPSPALEAIAVTTKPAFSPEQPTRPGAPKTQPSASRAPVPKPAPPKAPPAARAPITEVTAKPQQSEPKLVPARAPISEPKLVAKVAVPKPPESGPKIPAARAPITEVTAAPMTAQKPAESGPKIPTPRAPITAVGMGPMAGGKPPESGPSLPAARAPMNDVPKPPESGPELSGTRPSGEVLAATPDGSGTWLEAPDPDLSSRSVLAADDALESASRIPVDRRSGPIVAAAPDAVESGPVAAPAPASAPRLAFDFAAAPGAPAPELPLEPAPPPEPPISSSPTSDPGFANAPPESGRRIAVLPERDPLHATSTPSGEIVPVALPRRRMLPLLLAIGGVLAGIGALAAILSMVFGHGSSRETLVSAAGSSAPPIAATATATATETATATAPATAPATATATEAPADTATAAPSTDRMPPPDTTASAEPAPPTAAPRAPAFAPPKKKPYEPLGI